MPLPALQHRSLEMFRSCSRSVSCGQRLLTNMGRGVITVSSSAVLPRNAHTQTHTFPCLLHVWQHQHTRKGGMALALCTQSNATLMVNRVTRANVHTETFTVASNGDMRTSRWMPVSPCNQPKALRPPMRSTAPLMPCSAGCSSTVVTRKQEASLCRCETLLQYTFDCKCTHNAAWSYQCTPWTLPSESTCAVAWLPSPCCQCHLCASWQSSGGRTGCTRHDTIEQWAYARQHKPLRSDVPDPA